MSPQIGDDRDHISIEPADKDNLRIRIRLSAGTVFVIIFLLLLSCLVAMAALSTTGG